MRGRTATEAQPRLRAAKDERILPPVRFWEVRHESSLARSGDYGFAASQSIAGPINVTTYHYDNFRTGWNQIEPGLKPSNVRGAGFGLLHSTKLDDQVDAQPLVLAARKSPATAPGEVAYVATESNSVYAIDANSGKVLLHVNFGAPVPFTSLPGGCNNNGPNIGINSTPVIDPATNTLYVVTDTFESSQPVYRIHALDPGTLTDKVAPVVVSASGRPLRRLDLQFQSLRQPPARGAAHRQRQRLCRLRELLRHRRRPVARLGAGLEPEHADAARRQPAQQQARPFDRRFLPDLGVDVGLRPGGEHIGRHLLRHRQFRLQRRFLQPCAQHRRERRAIVGAISPR